jgi:hypothetical protein
MARLSVTGFAGFWHRHAFGIEKALEQKPEADRIEIGDGQRIGDERAGTGAAARPDRNALGLGPLDEVGDDEEVAGIFHAGDDAELEIEPFVIFLLGVPLRDAVALEPPLQPLQGFLAERCGLIGDTAAIAHGEARQDRRLGARTKGATLRDLDRRGQGLGHIGEQRRHFGAGLEAVLHRQLPPLGIGNELAFGDA